MRAAPCAKYRAPAMRSHFAQQPAPFRSAPVRPDLRAVPAEQPTLDAMAAMLTPGELPFRVVGGHARDVVRRLGLGPESRVSVALLGNAAGHWLTLISATRILDLEAATRAVGEPLAVAGPDAVRAALGDVDPAALCPLTSEPGVWQLVDHRLTRLPRLVCSAGSPDRWIVIEPPALMELLRPVVADVSVAAPTG
jgi:prolyl-tRNA editing enzyme YbaK/EbsC (Cys-tRNA(Pro) deacylase)